MPRMTTLSVLIVLSLVFIATASADRVSPYVIGGGEATMDSYPFVVQLQGGFNNKGQLDSEGDFRPFCSGSLIAPQWVLTAGHCIKGLGVPSRPQGAVKVVFANSSSQEEIAVDQALVHPGYFQGIVDQKNIWVDAAQLIDSRDTGTDVALLHLSSPSNISPVRLAKNRSQDRDYRNDTTIAGYGYATTAQDTLPDTLHVAKESLLSDKECNQQRVSYEYGTLANSQTQLCRRITRDLSGQQGITCNGDSGGPILLTDQQGWLQVGTVSWGSSASGGCWGNEASDIYSRVAAAYPWINSITQQHAAGFASYPWLGRVVMNKNGGLTVGWNSKHLGYTARWAVIRSVKRPWNGTNWMPLWYLGENMRFSYAKLNRLRHTSHQQLPRGSWRAGQCLNLFWQTISPRENYSILHQRSWLVVRKSRKLQLHRQACGYKIF